MIAVDTNVLIQALREDAPFHAQALAALGGLVGSGSRWGLPWPCVHEFLAVATHPRIFVPPTPPAIALRAVEVWMGTRGCVLLREGPGYWETLRELVGASKVAGPMIHDARIAALCLHHGVVELWTADRDFSRFPQLRTRNPLL